VPQGTPTFLINFIVLIEIIRILIRPITLSVRLTANILAGHLLISLLRNFIMRRNFFGIILLLPFILTVLERAVAFIQAYVFVTLVTLYATENQ
jgi:F-type H+-transporting ATPase subunit a